MLDAGSRRGDDPLVKGADLAVLVAEASPIGLVRAARLAADWAGPRPWLILNRVHRPRAAEVVAAARRWTGLEPTALVPESAAITIAARAARPPARSLSPGPAPPGAGSMSHDRFGFLAALLADPEVEEIIVLGGRRTFVVRGGTKELLPEVADSEQVRRIADQLLAGTGRRLDLADPIVSAQLADGSRVHLTGPPITHPDRLNIQVRKFVLRAARLRRPRGRGAPSATTPPACSPKRCGPTGPSWSPGPRAPARPPSSTACSPKCRPSAGWSPAKRCSSSRPTCRT